jgi:hypothetical protein
VSPSSTKLSMAHLRAFLLLGEKSIATPRFLSPGILILFSVLGSAYVWSYERRKRWKNYGSRESAETEKKEDDVVAFGFWFLLFRVGGRSPFFLSSEWKKQMKSKKISRTHGVLGDWFCFYGPDPLCFTSEPSTLFVSCDALSFSLESVLATLLQKFVFI